ncbi:iron-sulfur cluster assembly scaffold protein [Tautonia sociabilis]|uniref:Fe-S cluster protein n=1 Tax=Tautonia sociabilis TaxID=2080755 RepID=A0A432MN64_9BACT|nr:iron-sulfur cluster assembly scaffold protein [Tautonia sociabilis]RUL88884.1 Fe-S cluster protein [Tautonia sociabilis]
MDDAFYREELLDHFDSSPHRGRLEAADLGADLDNPLCGDQIHFEVALDAEDPGRIAAARFDGHGCVISQAAASILAEQVEGRPIAEARALTADHMIQWLGIPLTPARRKCGLLALRTLHRAIDQGTPGAPAGSGSPA